MIQKMRFNVKVFLRLLNFIETYRVKFIIATVMGVILSILATLRPLLTKLAIDDYITPNQMNGFAYFIMLMVGLLFVEAIIQFFFIYAGGWLAQNIIKDMRDRLFKHILYLRWSYFDKVKIGTIVTRVVSDIGVITNVFEQGLLVLFGDTIKILAIMVIMLIVNWKLSLMVFLIFPIMIYATRIFQKAIKKSFQQVRNEVSTLNSFVQEHITGMKIVQLFNREKEEHNKFKEINKRHEKANIQSVLYYSIFFPVVEVLSSLALGLVVWFGGIRVAFFQDMTLGDIVAFIFLINMLFRPLRQMADKFNTLQMGIVAGERVFKILDSQVDLEQMGELKLKDIKGEVSFKNVSFSYVPNEPVINDISFEIKHNETVAIVGATGAGKSTIISLLNRFYPINAGQITIDGINLKNIEAGSLRQHIAVILQEVFLFSDTIYNNIILGNKRIEKSKVIDAAKRIGIHKFIESLPEGYNYNIKERGGMLSVGQRQLISFLRAYMQNPTIFILDEATSSVDTHSEILIQKAMDTLTQNRTSIIIAHRLATVQKADKIIVMKQGKIVEIGTHKQLLEIPSGYYRKLYQIQFEQ